MPVASQADDEFSTGGVLGQAISPIMNKTGVAAPPSRRHGGDIAAFKAPVTRAGEQQKGPAPNLQRVPWIKAFIPPLSLFNDASHWVNRLMFTRPMPFMQAPDSNPPPPPQYSFGPRPMTTNPVAAGNANLQAQLGNIKIQGAKLDQKASDYFGG